MVIVSLEPGHSAAGAGRMPMNAGVTRPRRSLAVIRGGAARKARTWLATDAVSAGGPAAIRACVIEHRVHTGRDLPRTKVQDATLSACILWVKMVSSGNQVEGHHR